MAFHEMCRILLVIFLFTSVSSSQTAKVGNDIKASSSGVDVRGATFLMNDMVESEGILFAYSAFFRSDSAVRFQIWRPTGSDASSFTLVKELRTVPSVINQREDVYLASRLTETCTRVYPKDRLGIYFEEDPGAVSYTFDPDHHTALAHTLKNLSEPHEVGDVVDFGTLLFPYDFSASAYTDTNLTVYGAGEELECPQGLLIPNEDIGSLQSTTTAPPPTGKPGATGATGPMGPAGATGLSGPAGEQGPEGPVGATGATGPQGASGVDGQAGATGATGAMGPMGVVGATGPQGEKGERGPAGAPGPAGPVGTMSPESLAALMEDDSALGGDMMVMGLLVWVAVVTLLLIIFIIIVIIMSRRHKKDREIIIRTPQHPGFNNRLSTKSYGDIPQDSWMSTLKGQSHHDVSVSVVDAEGNEKAALPADYIIETETTKHGHMNGALSGSVDHLVTDTESASDAASMELKNY